MAINLFAKLAERFPFITHFMTKPVVIRKGVAVTIETPKPVLKAPVYVPDSQEEVYFDSTVIRNGIDCVKIVVKETGERYTIPSSLFYRLFKLKR